MCLMVDVDGRSVTSTTIEKKHLKGFILSIEFEF